MNKLQKEIEQYDKKYWDLYDKPKIDNIHHIVGHLNKLLGKIGEYTDVYDHTDSAEQEKVINEAIPDLLAHGYRLANLFSVDAEQLFEKRLASLREHFDAQKVTNE